MKIFIFGPSCSGKSTLSHALQKRLGQKWSYIDRDDLIESKECTESQADAGLESKIKLFTIIDAQIPWRSKQSQELYCLLLPPLSKLLERDSNRTIHLNRSEKKAFWAKKFVIDTHEMLSKRSQTDFDLCVDSSEVTVEETVSKIEKLLPLMESSR